MDTRCCLEYPPGALDDKDGWQERDRGSPCCQNNLIYIMLDLSPRPLFTLSPSKGWSQILHQLWITISQRWFLEKKILDKQGIWRCPNASFTDNIFPLKSNLLYISFYMYSFTPHWNWPSGISLFVVNIYQKPSAEEENLMISIPFESKISCCKSDIDNKWYIRKVDVFYSKLISLDITWGKTGLCREWNGFKDL